MHVQFQWNMLHQHICRIANCFLYWRWIGTEISVLRGLGVQRCSFANTSPFNSAVGRSACPSIKLQPAHWLQTVWHAQLQRTHWLQGRMERAIRSVQHEVLAWYGRRVLRRLVTTSHGCAVYQKTWRTESSTDVRTPKLGTFEGCNCDVCTSNTTLYAQEVAVRAVPSADLMNASHLNTFSSFLSLL
jgi:hypothetical protein